MTRPNQFLSPEGDLEDYFVDEYWLIDQWVGDELWVWGRGDVGSTGTNISIGNVLTPVTTFSGGTNWKQVSNGGYASAAIKSDGTLWTWGYTGNGRLGNAIVGNDKRLTPITTFAGGTNWKQVSVGNRHVAAIKTDGTLWTWGYNNNGQLGNALTTGNISTPITTFAGGTNWKYVSAGNNISAAIKTDGTLWTWGYTDTNSGQLGNNQTTSSRVSTPVTTFAGGTNWKQVCAGYRFMTAVKTDGTLWTWGYNRRGRLGINGGPGARYTPVTTFAGGTNWKQVHGGTFNDSHVVAVKTDGTLWTWGYNGNNQLGNISNVTTSTPVTTFAGGTNWKQASAGNAYTGAIKTDGTLWVWGSASLGKLGDNRNQNFGANSPFTTFAGGTNWKQVDCSSMNTMAVFSGTTPDLPIS